MMKAWLLEAPTGNLNALKLTQLPVPEPGKGEVRIKVFSVALNPVGLLLSLLSLLLAFFQRVVARFAFVFAFEWVSRFILGQKFWDACAHKHNRLEVLVVELAEDSSCVWHRHRRSLCFLLFLFLLSHLSGMNFLVCDTTGIVDALGPSTNAAYKVGDRVVTHASLSALHGGVVFSLSLVFK